MSILIRSKHTAPCPNPSLNLNLNRAPKLQIEVQSKQHMRREPRGPKEAQEEGLVVGGAPDLADGARRDWGV
jgi:hypothetical protein